MQYVKPVYFDEFSCVAGACPDTCCAGWQIMIDEASLEKYGEVQGSFGNRLRNSIDWMEGAFYQYEKRCAFLNEEDLCDIYSELGPDALCDTCRLYPRHVEEYEDVREWSLSLSCPIAAKMLLGWQGEVPLIYTETDEEEDLDDFEDFDCMLYTQLSDARDVCLQKLWNPEISIESCMKEMLSLAHDMQKMVDEGEFFKLEELIAEYRDKDWSKSGQEPSYEDRLELYHQINNLERLRPEWSAVLEETYDILYGQGEEGYRETKEQFFVFLEGDEAEKQRWDNVSRQLLFFFIYTYFCGAVYDDWIYSKMALSVESVRFIRELFVARWMRNGKTLSMETYVELSYRYAREIEHSDQNLNEMEEKFVEKVIDN